MDGKDTQYYGSSYQQPGHPYTGTKALHRPLGPHNTRTHQGPSVPSASLGISRGSGRGTTHAHSAAAPGIPVVPQNPGPLQGQRVPRASNGVFQASGSGTAHASTQNAQAGPSTQRPRRAKGRAANGVTVNGHNVRVVDPAGPWLELSDPTTGNRGKMFLTPDTLILDTKPCVEPAVRHADIRDRLLWESDQIAAQDGGYGKLIFFSHDG